MGSAALKGFKGFFEYLYLLNDFSYFDELQGCLERSGVRFRGYHLVDIILYELLRINLGVRSYKEFERLLWYMNGPPLKLITRDKERVPRAADMSSEAA